MAYLRSDQVLNHAIMKEDLKKLNINSTLYTTRLSGKFENRKPYAKADAGHILSFIPGTVTEILVTVGQKIRKGDEVLVLNAMKMQNRIKSPIDVEVKRINVSKGDRVSKGMPLAEIG